MNSLSALGMFLPGSVVDLAPTFTGGGCQIYHPVSANDSAGGLRGRKVNAVCGPLLALAIAGACLEVTVTKARRSAAHVNGTRSLSHILLKTSSPTDGLL